ncbi:uncharacterized protein BJ212DRAFT_1354973 [Suillus subaureus]|uniref:Secreted protein n=1 Tax=Suillus subaureus TaxID=48587 RepID=A0A9P7JDC1_9AGAM|nr:uncharacterized protein BJ212DRAFT_1354973 [Suillus subaureus]KAG1816473.1 hypothetical protein BJ212DRAFT_1354973 [Suillus subaureus]
MTVFLAYALPSSTVSLLIVMQAEIPGQDGYNTEPNFFHGMNQHSQISRPRHQQRHGRLKRLRFAVMRTPRSTPPPASVAPTTSSPVAAATTLRTHLRQLFTRPPHHATPPVADVSYAQGLQRYAAAGAPGSEHSLIRDEDYHGPPTPDANLQQQQQLGAVQADRGEHGGRSCCCC